ncbi:MAG TPA: hypothetical protein PLY90_03490 [Candidatus Hydrogenedentes bacterium]|nr:hypothetical protein [Candidatus Hydrogenedentota bacterium]HOD95012.1 hypothetical protein [Candidatus Hydrogenedentota bacterium]HPX85927.1 hypothetical protein [Candidatus Hydrogenedentota bacterium]HQB02340.1 hypothetical protein [Candidatus Hydrogenedentota bacterium]
MLHIPGRWRGYVFLSVSDLKSRIPETPNGQKIRLLKKFVPF